MRMQSILSSNWERVAFRKLPRGARALLSPSPFRRRSEDGVGLWPDPVFVSSLECAALLEFAHANSKLLEEEPGVTSSAYPPFRRRCANGVRISPRSVLHFRLTGDSNLLSSLSQARCSRSELDTNAKRSQTPKQLNGTCHDVWRYNRKTHPS